jgi:hypothetical protein
MLDQAHQDLAKKNGSNINQLLYDLYFWQEVCKLADTELKKAWKTAQADDGPVDTDDDLRQLTKGEHIVCESDDFSCLVTVQGPRANFDRELFVESLCKAFKLKRASVDKVAENCLVETKPPLQKRVVEVA